ncbi:MAG: hypothetical protein JXR97_10770 [Planctomycetes bacterium]|nr:hypothetical protein [Planctomycetota bacterium]
MTDEAKNNLPDNGHEHSHPKGEKCSPQCACHGGAAPTEEDYRIIEEDAATRSLSRALMTSFALLKIIMIVIVAFFVIDCVTFIDQGQVGIKKRFGAYVRDAKTGRVKLYQAGEAVFVLPMPLEELQTIPYGQDRSIKLESEFWPKGNPGRKAPGEDDEQLQPKKQLTPDEDGYNLTSGSDISRGTVNIIHSRWEIRYRISDPEKYVLATANTPKPEINYKLMLRPQDGGITQADLKPDDYLTPEDILRSIACSVIARNMAGVSVDDAIKGKESSRLLDNIKSDLQSEMSAQADYGIEVLTVQNLGAPVPGETKASFDAVNSALSELKSKKEKAKGDREKVMQEAKSKADKVVNDARVYKQRVIAKARADAEYVTSILLASPFVEQKDITNWSALAKTVISLKGKLGDAIRASMSKKSLAAVQSVAKTGNASDEMKGLIIEGLRAAQINESLHAEENIKGMKLRAEAMAYIAHDTEMKKLGEPEGIFLKEDEMLNRMILDAVLAGSLKPMSSIYADPEDLAIFLEQNHMNTISEVLAKAKLHIVQPGQKSVLITGPRPPAPKLDDQNR